MEFPADYLKKFSIKKKQTAEQALAGEIYEESGKQLSFGLLMKMIQLKGGVAVREIWQETKKSDADDYVKLFMYKLGQNKIIWE